MKQHENDVRFLEWRAPFDVVSFKAETFPRFLEGQAAFLQGKAACSKGKEAFLQGDASPLPPVHLPLRKAALPFSQTIFVVGFVN